MNLWTPKVTWLPAEEEEIVVTKDMDKMMNSFKCNAISSDGDVCRRGVGHEGAHTGTRGWWTINTTKATEFVIAPPGPMRTFPTGATREEDHSKPDYEGFFSPTVLQRFGEYMHKHRLQADGALRASDNWQKGIPLPAYMKSLLRHVMDVWLIHRGHPGREGMEDALCAIIFNTQGYLHEILKAKAQAKCAEDSTTLPGGQGV